MNKYRLTTLFVLISVLTLGTAAFALNHLAAKTAETNLVDLTTEQSMRDASIIAGIVNQLLDDNAFGPSDQPARLAHSIPIESQKLLDSLRVIDITMYNDHGHSLWSTSADLISERTVSSKVIEAAGKGEITSILGAVEIGIPESSDSSNISDSDERPASSSRTANVVETYLPLLASSGTSVVGVIGVTRDVTTTLSAQIAETRSSVSLITLVSLGSVFLVLLVFIFVTDIRMYLANSQKIRYERELSDRLMLDSLELKRVGKMKDRFLSSITHELMTPLTSIAAFTGILLRNKEKNLGEKDIDHLQIMKRNAVHLQRLLDNLLELSVMNKGEYELTVARFNLRQTLDEVTEAFMPAIERKSQNLHREYDDADAIVEADDGRIRQAISNILTNAIRYSPEGTDIKVSAWITDLLFTVTITDNGIGITDDDKEELFTMFFRVDNEPTRSVAGTGIGLVSSKQIVELHGGELVLESAESEGTEVHISVPRFRSRQSAESEIDLAA